MSGDGLIRIFITKKGLLLPHAHSPSQTPMKMIYFSLHSEDTSIFFGLFVLYIILSMMVRVRVLSHILYTTLISFNFSWAVRELSLSISYSQHAECENQSQLYCFVHASPVLM